MLFILFISLFFQTRAKRESYLPESLPRDLSRDVVVHYRSEAFSVVYRHKANIWSEKRSQKVRKDVLIFEKHIAYKCSIQIGRLRSSSRMLSVSEEKLFNL